MATTSITIRLDSSLKAQAENLFDSMGMNMTTALTVFMKAAVREGRIPFDIKGDPFYCTANMEALDVSMDQLRQGKTVTKTLDELRAMENE